MKRVLRRQYTYSKLAFAKLYDRKTPITAADLINDRVVPFFDTQEVTLCRVLTDRGTEYCGNPEHHEYELYLALEDIDHTRTKTKSPQTNGIVERFHKTVLNEFYRVVFRKKIYGSIAELQRDLVSPLPILGGLHHQYVLISFAAGTATRPNVPTTLAASSKTGSH